MSTIKSQTDSTSKFDSLRQDMLSLVEACRALDVLRPLMEKKDDASNTLADVWNTLIDLQLRIIHKVFDNSPELKENFEYVVKARSQ